MSIKACLALAFSLILTSGILPAQELAPKVDIAYGKEDTKAQALDVYLAKSDTATPVMIYIHGGGWRAGSKANIPGYLAQGVAKGWFSVVSVEYRFTDVAPHPAQVNDCVRAVQFVRQHASEWNIDPKRVGVTGGSAGAHLSLWVALHDDAADPDSEDPVQRQSSRVSCVISFAGPTDWQLLSEIEHKHPAYRQLLGYEPGTPAAEMSAELKKDVSPITFVSKDDPPVLLVHGDADDIVPVRHAQDIDAKLDAIGVPSELFVVKGANHAVAGAGGDAVAKRTLNFIKEHLQIKDAE